MKRNLLTIGLLAFSFSASAQVICHVDPSGLFYVGENALVYNGGGVQTKGSGQIDVHGNVMIVGATSDVLKTWNDAGTAAKTDGGNIILRLNDVANFGTSTYGQLYVNGMAQGNITAVVDKEFRAPKHGTYQQIALPFYDKTINTLSGATSAIGTFGKTFANARYSQNEVLTWNNTTAVSDNLSIWATTPKSTTYYMLGSKNLDTGAPPTDMTTIAPTATGAVFTIKGVPYTNGVSENLKDAAKDVNFGATNNGGNTNSYGERYRTYIEDPFDIISNPTNPFSVSTYGRNMYQYGNPFFTNIDLSQIAIAESATVGDGNNLVDIQGIRFDPGNVVTGPASGGGTTTFNPLVVTFTNGTAPIGDVDKLIIKPMQTFVVKMKNNNTEVGGNRTLNFDTLRRFKNTARLAGTNYSVTANRGQANAGSIKQLGVIGLDEDGKEVARTYYAVYPDAISGHTTEIKAQCTVGNQSLIGTYEEDAANGGIDPNYSSSYWLYINEANEQDFFGKAVGMALYNLNNVAVIKSLKFEIRENAELIEDGAHSLSTGIGFYYKSTNGEISEAHQNMVIPVDSDKYNLYYGKSTTVLGTDASAKPSRTMVMYSKAIDNFIVRFDPLWKKAEVKVYDMSGKLISSKQDIITDKDYVLNLGNLNNAYIVTAISEKGEKISSKIIR